MRGEQGGRRGEQGRGGESRWHWRLPFGSDPHVADGPSARLNALSTALVRCSPGTARVQLGFGGAVLGVRSSAAAPPSMRVPLGRGWEGEGVQGQEVVVCRAGHLHPCERLDVEKVHVAEGARVGGAKDEELIADEGGRVP